MSGYTVVGSFVCNYFHQTICSDFDGADLSVKVITRYFP